MRLLAPGSYGVTQAVRNAVAAAVDPRLFEAQLYIDAARNAGSGVNEGTVGSTLDATGVAFADGSVDLAAIFPGTGGVYASTPDAAALDLTGDFCIAVDVHPDWSHTAPFQIVSKPTVGTDDCYAFGISQTTGVPYIEFNRDGVVGHEAHTFSTPTATVQIDPGTDGDTDRKQWVLEFDADNGAGGWTANLYSGTPGSTTLLSSIVNTADGAVTLETSTESLVVGQALLGAVYRMRLYSGLLASPTLIAEFYPDRDWTSGTTMTAADTDEVWSNVTVIDEAAFIPTDLTTLTIPDDASLDVAADADATFAFWFTQRDIADVDGELFAIAGRSTGTLGNDGIGFRVLDIKIAAASSDFAGAVLGSGAGQQAFVVGAHWTAGTHLAVLTIDRSTTTATLYVDGAVHATASISAVGALNPAAALILGAAAHHAVVKWDRVYTPAEVAAMRD